MSFPSKCGEVVLGVSMNCEGCATKVQKWALKFEGVTKAEPDLETNTVTVRGTVDPSKIKYFLSENTKKKVDVISWRAKGESSVVILVGCLCSSCVRKLKKIVADTKGIESWRYNPQKLTVRVKGQTNMKALRQTLRYKLKEHDREGHHGHRGGEKVAPRDGGKRRHGGGEMVKLKDGRREKVAAAEKQPNAIFVFNIEKMMMNLQLVPGKPHIRREGK